MGRARLSASALILALLISTEGHASPSPPQTLRSPAWARAHLSPRGLLKCRAYQDVWTETRRLQAGDRGQLPPEWRRRLSTKIANANAMAPKSVTPRMCGVPL